MYEKIFADMTLSERLNVADIFSVIRAHGEEVATFYKDKNFISAERFDALVEISEQKELIREIESLLEEHKTGDKCQKHEVKFRIEELCCINGEIVNVIANLLRA